MGKLVWAYKALFYRQNLVTFIGICCLLLIPIQYIFAASVAGKPHPGINILLLNKSLSHSLTPVLLFSDMESAPKTGWSSSEPNKGAAITIWGRGFGDTRGSSYVTVNGVDLTRETDYAVWGEYWPTPYYQKVTFWLNSHMADGLGTISVTVNGETSNILPFTIRSGRLFFITNSNSGGLGDHNDPFDFSEARSGEKWLSNMQAGDIFYFRDAEDYSERTNGGKQTLWIRNTNTSGTQSQPISFIGYPNEKPLFKTPDTADVNFNRAYTVETNYNVFSGFKIVSSGWGADVNGNYQRFVGNDVEASSFDGTVGTGIINVGGDGHKVYGNSAHGLRSDNKHDHALYINGCADEKGDELGWNYVYDNIIDVGPEVVVNHQQSRCSTDVYLKAHFIFNNVVHCSLNSGRAIGVYDQSWDEGEANEPEPTFIYNNLVVDCGGSVFYHNNGHARFYNNVIYNGKTPGFQLNRQGSTIGDGIPSPKLSTYIKNNIFYMNSSSTGDYIYAEQNQESLFASTSISNNLFYGIGEYPGCSSCAEDVNNINNQDPLFSNPSTNLGFSLSDFVPSPSSPAIDAGLTETELLTNDPYASGINLPYPISWDILGNLRNGSYDLGVVEFLETQSGSQ